MLAPLLMRVPVPCEAAVAVARSPAMLAVGSRVGGCWLGVESCYVHSLLGCGCLFWARGLGQCLWFVEGGDTVR